MLRASLGRYFGVVAFLLGVAALPVGVTSCGGDTSSTEDELSSTETEEEDDETSTDDGAGGEPATTPADTAAEPEQPATDPGADDPAFEMTNPATLAEGAIECSYTRVPNEKITDFSTWSAGQWGDAMSLTGGSFVYPEGGLTVEVDTAAGTAHITGSIAANGYAGWGLWFGPCTNASRWSGVRFVAGGSLGATGQLQVQLQTNNNYPLPTAGEMKGACNGTFSDGCGFSSHTMESFPAEPTEVALLWNDFSGGNPVDAVEPAELLGIQWQFNCGPEACEVDVTMDIVEFY